MLKKWIPLALSLVSTAAYFPAYADGDANCRVEVSVAAL